MPAEIDYGEFKDLNDGIIIPKILDDIGNAVTNNIRIEVVTLKDFNAPENYLTSGRVGSVADVMALSINPEFRFPSVLAHELLHIFFDLKGYPAYKNKTEEIERFPYETHIGMKVGNLVTHKLINRYLNKANIHDDGYNEAFVERLSTWHPGSSKHPYLILLRVLALIMIKQDQPGLIKSAVQIYEKYYPSISTSYEELAGLFRQANWRSAHPASAFSSMVQLLNLTNRFKDESLGLTGGADLCYVNSFFPVFVSKNNLIKQASEYLEPVKYENRDHRLGILKVIYLHKGSKNQKTALAYKECDPGNIKEEGDEIYRLIRSSTLGDILDYLEKNFDVPENWITVS